MGKRVWSKEEIDFVRRLRAKGRGYTEISHQWEYKFGAPAPNAHAICHAFNRLGGNKS